MMGSSSAARGSPTNNYSLLGLEKERGGWPTIASTEDIDRLIAAGSAVAVGVSGGKDSQAAALATFAYLDTMGHIGPRCLIHSNLGEVVEWSDSLRVCRALAEFLQCELVIVRRKAGGLMIRWESRWASSVRRYAELSTVTLVPPWSTPALRFCTSEMKTHIINAELRRRYKGAGIINVTGVRREESAARSKCTIAGPEKDGLSWNWRPIATWSKEHVFAYIEHRGIALHPGYRVFGLSRVSCRFCIMSSLPDLVAAAAVAESHHCYRQMVGLEIASTFAFQSGRWLGDIAPQLLTERMRNGVAQAKAGAASRERAEAAILPGMLYVDGWPTRMLTDPEAEILAVTRRTISALIGIEAACLDVPSIHARYRDLMELAAAKRGGSANRVGPAIHHSELQQLQLFGEARAA